MGTRGHPSRVHPWTHKKSYQDHVAALCMEWKHGALNQDTWLSPLDQLSMWTAVLHTDTFLAVVFVQSRGISWMVELRVHVFRVPSQLAGLGWSILA